MTVLGILAFIFILGAAVVLHEFGHFIVAKLFKIRVETFSVGFGPRLFGRKWGHTDYRVSAIPLGGYVKLGGDESNARSKVPVLLTFPSTNGSICDRVGNEYSWRWSGYECFDSAQFLSPGR